MLTIEEKLKIIDSALNFEEVRNAGILPEPDSDDGYYFVSYSHSDYKRVLPDIIELQKRGIKIWYDRGLETGISWLEDVCRKIDSFYCKGVLVYVGKNLIQSAACQKEIQQTILSKKSCLLIRIDDSSLDKDFSYSSDIHVDADYDDKVDMIHSLPAPELYDFEIYKGSLRYFMRPFAILTAVNDKGIQKIQIPSYIERNNKKYPVRAIGAYAFANCTNLTDVTIPDGWVMIYLEAFANCCSLKTVNFGRPYRLFGFFSLGGVLEAFVNCAHLETLSSSFIDKKIGLGGVVLYGAFQNCISLKRIDLPKDFIFTANCFSCCSELEYVRFNGRLQFAMEGMFAYDSALKKVEYDNSKRAVTDVPAYAYFFSGLQEINLPKEILTLCDSAFAGCRNLVKIDLPSKLKTIRSKAFAESGLMTVRIPKRVNTISYTAFEKAFDLKSVSIDSKAVKIIDCDGLKDVTIDEIFPFAETIYLTARSENKISNKFIAVPTDQPKYKKYVRRAHA